MTKKIEKLRNKHEVILARLRKEEALEKQRARKQDTRRKIIVGAYLLERMEKDPELRAKVLSALGRTLTRQIDRGLFDLPAPRSQTEAS